VGAARCPWLAKRIQPEWLKSNGFHEIEADVDSSSMLLRNNHQFRRSWTPFASRMMVRK
jgi:hypothetical protein